MKIESSEQIFSTKRPIVKSGTYKAKLVEIKPKEQECKFGKKLIFVFELLSPEYEVEGKKVKLAKEVYYSYRQEDGKYKSAVNPKSEITKVFEACGWNFNKEGIDTEKFINSEVSLLVDSYEYEWIDPLTNKPEIAKASCIVKIKKYDDSE